MNSGRSMVLVACLVAAPAITAAGAQPAAGRLPPPASADFCVTVQQLMAGTSLRGENTVFTDMPSYRHSKPFVKPLRIYQVVTYAGHRPIVVSCKVKTAAQLRAVYGPQAAGTQRSCPDLTRLARDQAVAALRQAGNAAAAARAAAFVVDDDEPYITGQSYLGDFQAIHAAADGRTHLSSPGLFQDYDRWFTRFLPEKFQGQAYCHLPTVDYIEAVATGEMPPGATITTGEDAPVTPR
ncbi:MAG: hypothetical protein IT485_08695 [Gammaproteobacteria bacterium]|nr:hypothetical protein [Gammaproteobacteria bacterium]